MSGAVPGLVAVVGGRAGGRLAAILACVLSVAIGAVPAAAIGQTTQPVAGPLAEYSTYIVSTHYLRGQAYETHHYFKPLRDGVLQGLVFRQATAGTPLIEVEWAISQTVFDQLPDWQKEFWHPLAPAVDAGRIRLPGLAAAEEQEMLRTVRGLYAQTLNLAGIEGELPVGLEGVAMVTHITREEMLRALREQR
jgi:acetyl esterase/lipase